MTTDEISGKPRVPIGELRELVDEWDEYSSGCRCCTSHVYKLQEVIERYE